MASEIRGLVFMFAILLAVFVSPGTGYVDVCPPTWTYYWKENICLRLFKYIGIWSWAKLDCPVHRQGSLAIIRDEHKNTFISALIPKGKAAWIGAYKCTGSDIPLSFVDGTKPGSYKPIRNPMTEKYEDCMALTRSTDKSYWVYRKCSDGLQSLCQMATKFEVYDD